MGAREMTTTDVEYTVKISLLLQRNKLMSEFCCVSIFLEIFILLFFFASSVSFAPKSSYAAG